MKARIPAKTLNNMIAAVVPVLAKGDGITSGIHIQVDDLGKIILTATDYETTVQVWNELESEGEPGIAVMPGATMAKACGTLPDGAIVTLTASFDKGGGVVEAGRTRFELEGFKPEEWPDSLLDTLGDGHRTELPAKSLALALRATVPFASDDQSQPALCGVLFEAQRGDLIMVATDGHRLGSFAGSVLPDSVKLRAIVGSLTMVQLRRALANNPNHEPIVELMGDQIAFIVGNTTIQSRKIAENFPDYSRVIPDHARHACMDFKRADLLETIARAASMATYDKKDEGTMIACECDGKTLHFKARNHGQGQGHDELDLFGGGGGVRFKCGMNPAYLTQALRVFDGEVVTLQVDDQFSPIRITSDESPGIILVVMPMRL